MVIEKKPVLRLQKLKHLFLIPSYFILPFDNKTFTLVLNIFPIYIQMNSKIKQTPDGIGV